MTGRRRPGGVLALAAAVARLCAAAAVSVRRRQRATVTLAAPAARIVSLAPHATELLFAAGAGARVVGVIATSDFPPQANAMPRVGDARALDLERIVAARAGSRRHVAVDGARAGRRRFARAASPVFTTESDDDRRHRAGPGAAGRARRQRTAGARRGPPHSARGSRGCAGDYRGRAARARVLRDLGRAALHDRRRTTSSRRRDRSVRRRERVRDRSSARAGGQRRGGARGAARTRSSPAPTAACARRGSTTGGAGRRCPRSRATVSSPSTPICCTGRAALRRRRRRIVRGDRQGAARARPC